MILKSTLSFQKSSGGNERETVLKNISSAYDAFMELKGNLEEGTKFYNDLTEILVKFQSKVSRVLLIVEGDKTDNLIDSLVHRCAICAHAHSVKGGRFTINLRGFDNN